MVIETLPPSCEGEALQSVNSAGFPPPIRGRFPSQHLLFFMTPPCKSLLLGIFLHRVGRPAHPAKSDANLRT